MHLKTYLPRFTMCILLALIGLASGCADQAPDQAPAPVEPVANAAESVTLQFNVQGMTCGGCASGIVGTLNEMEGVTAANASYETGTADITVTDAALAETVQKAIADLGFEVSLKDEAGS